jgi:hypothetical protein
MLTKDERERWKLNGLIRCGDEREDALDLEQIQQRTQRMLRWDSINNVV